MTYRNAVRLLTACFLLIACQTQASETVRVFLLAGQSNIQGKGQSELGRDIVGYDLNNNPIMSAQYAGGPGSLRYQVNNDPANFGHLVDSNGDWIVRDDVYVWSRNGIDLNGDGNKNDDTQTGNLAPVLGSRSDWFGPEFGFGHAVGNAYEDQVALVKVAWGGKSLAVDFRPPSAVEKRGGEVGEYYNLLVSNVQDALLDLADQFPDKTIELTGMGWHQGFNDRINYDYVIEYEANMVDFINDIREDLSAAELPFVIASTGMGGFTHTGSAKTRTTLHVQGQLNVADPDLHPKLEGTVAAFDTRPLYLPPELSPASDGSHWNQNGQIYYQIGDMMGAEMIALVPEPSSLVLLGVGGLLLTRRRSATRLSD